LQFRENKEALNVNSSDDEDTVDSDDGLNVQQLLDKYEDLNESQDDPDFEAPENLNTSNESQDSFNEKTESQIGLDGKHFMKR
jgi:hypothetical protein